MKSCLYANIFLPYISSTYQQHCFLYSQECISNMEIILPNLNYLIFSEVQHQYFDSTAVRACDN